MVITKEQALTLRHGDILHYEGCTSTVGPRGGVHTQIEHWRVNGRVKTWKRQPELFEIPIKYGLKSYGYLDDKNAHLFHLEADCPIALQTS